jgi:hypothetical protein
MFISPLMHTYLYQVKSWVIFNEGQFTQLNVGRGQDPVSGIVLFYQSGIDCWYNWRMPQTRIKPAED